MTIPASIEMSYAQDMLQENIYSSISTQFHMVSLHLLTILHFYKLMARIKVWEVGLLRVLQHPLFFFRATV